MTEYEFVRKNLSLSADFNAYLASHPDFLLELPEKVHIVFEIKNNKHFSGRNLEIARKTHERYLIASKVGNRWETRRP